MMYSAFGEPGHFLPVDTFWIANLEKKKVSHGNSKKKKKKFAELKLFTPVAAKHPLLKFHVYLGVEYNAIRSLLNSTKAACVLSLFCN